MEIHVESISIRRQQILEEVEIDERIRTGGGGRGRSSSGGGGYCAFDERGGASFAQLLLKHLDGGSSDIQHRNNRVNVNAHMFARELLLHGLDVHVHSQSHTFLHTLVAALLHSHDQTFAAIDLT